MLGNFYKKMLSLLLVLVASFSFGQNSKDIVFEKNTLTFKKTEEGKLVNIKFSFTYLGDNPLFIEEPKVDCSCTTVRIPNKSIVKNSQHIIQVVFDTKGKLGYQVRSIELVFKNQEDKAINKTITFKGVVKASKSTKNIYKESR